MTDTITPEEVAGLAKAATPGPWRWEVNRHAKEVALCGGKPMFDKNVVSFRRYGVNGAAPVFWRWIDGRSWAGPPQRAEELAVEVKGREHHASWFATIDHPDAAFIAAAPAMARLIATQAVEIERLREALKLAANRFDVVVINAIADGQHGYAEALREWRDETRAALEQEGG